MPVGYDAFLAVVQRWIRVDNTVAERATRAVLQTLAERLSKADASQLAAQLPAELVEMLEPLDTTGGPEEFDVDEFVRRVAEREHVDLDTAEEHARAVFAAVRSAVIRPEFDLLAALPEDIRTLGTNAPVRPAAEIVRRVADRARTDPETAARAVDAIVETLAERIAPGDVHDLVAHLPLRFHEQLRRGRVAGSLREKRLGADEFVERVAVREGVSMDEALQHARAVFAVLRDAVGDEFFDVSVQLPNEYAPLLTTR
ncbi:MAG: hypothetical protein QOI55_2990 [Actinomycetota bacterium]|jgi:uncharacterized protein (DUF2267 family)|nr:hypothetical protein [Actinomycetota bacterium]